MRTYLFWGIFSMITLIQGCLSSVSDGAGSTFSDTSLGQTPPCWFNEPSPDGVIGSIGVARNLAARKGVPLLVGKRRAVAGLLPYINISLSEKELDQLISKGGKEIVLSDQVVHLGDNFIREGQLYQYAYIGSPSSIVKSCSVKTPSIPEKCEPQWFCSPSREGVGGVVGVSFRASSPSRQLQIAVNNGIKLLEYTYGVEVEGRERYIRGRNQSNASSDIVGTMRLSIRNLDVRKNKERLPDTIRIYIKEQRLVGENLFVWLVSPDLPDYPSPVNLEWIHSPGTHGAVGIAGKAVLLSRQIDIAVQKGVAELAKLKGIDIQSIDYIRQSRLGKQTVSDTSVRYDSRVEARVRAMHLDKAGKVFVLVVVAE